MPAVYTGDFLHTSSPHQVQLPPLAYMTPPEVRQAAETYMRLHGEA